MRPEERIDNFLRILGDEWKKQGVDLRFCQFLFNNGIRNTGGYLYYWEENSILLLLKPDISPREYLFWGTYGKDGKQPFTYKLIKDLDTDHIKNILETQVLNKAYMEAFQDELKLREKT